MKYAVIDVVENLWLDETDDYGEALNLLRKRRKEGLPTCLVEILISEDEDGQE